MKHLAILICLFISSRSFADSSFNEVKTVVFGANPASNEAHINDEMQVYDHGELPHYQVNASRFIVDGVNRLLDRANRTLNDSNDYYPRLEKLVHSNGACFAGVWSITEASPYSGYFKQGSRGLFIGRASTALNETERGKARSFGFAGKIFPTMNPDQIVKTANFFLVDVLMGKQTNHYLDTKMTNNPRLGFRLSVLGLAFKIFNIFKGIDSNPGYRPVYPISEAGLMTGEKIVTPKYMMLETDKSVERNDDIDFRDEINLQKNHVQPITFNILVNDDSKKINSSAWTKVGQIQVDQSTISYGCDRRLHFQHPKMK